MTYFEFFSKYSDMLYYLTFLLGVTNISYNFFEYLSYSHKYDSSQLSQLEGRIHTRLNDIDNKIDMLYKEISHAVSDSDSETNSNSENEQSDYEIEEDSIENEDTDANDNDNEDNNSDSDSLDKEELETIEELEELEELEEPEENVCVDQNDINDYYKDKFIKDKQSNSLSFSGIFRDWY